MNYQIDKLKFKLSNDLRYLYPILLETYRLINTSNYLSWINTTKFLIDYSEKILYKFNILLKIPEITIKDNSFTIKWSSDNYLFYIDICNNDAKYYYEDIYKNKKEQTFDLKTYSIYSLPIVK